LSTVGNKDVLQLLWKMSTTNNRDLGFMPFAQNNTDIDSREKLTSKCRVHLFHFDIFRYGISADVTIRLVTDTLGTIYRSIPPIKSTDPRVQSFTLATPSGIQLPRDTRIHINLKTGGGTGSTLSMHANLWGVWDRS